MTEHEVIAAQQETELLARYDAASLADITDRQLTSFRSSSGLTDTNPSWKLLLAKWKAAANPAEADAARIRAESSENNEVMNEQQLQELNEENLFRLLTRGADQSTQQEAAYELYQRKSRFIQTPEFAAHKAYCVDKELQLAASGQATPDPGRALDGLGNLHQRAAANQADIARVDQNLQDLEDFTAESLEATADAITGLGEAMKAGIDVLADAHQAGTRKLLIWLSVLSAGNIAAIVLLFLHHAR